MIGQMSISHLIPLTLKMIAGLKIEKEVDLEMI